MAKFANTVLNTLGVLFALCFVTFFLGLLNPTDGVLSIIGDSTSKELYDSTRTALGLDLPVYIRFYHYIVSLLQGNWGQSLMTGHPVLQDLRSVFPATIELATFAMLLATCIGIPLGVIAALHQNSWIDYLLRIIGLLGNSISIFWLALLSMLIFYLKLSWLPGPGRIDLFFDYVPHSGFLLIDSLLTRNWALFLNGIHHIILPGSILAFYKLGHISRMMRAYLLAELKQEYVITALMKGLSRTQAVLFHALPNALLPMITIMALSYGTLLEGSTFIENIFMWPGVGLYLTGALMNNDMHAVLGATLVIGSIFVIINKFADFLYKTLDCRLC